MPEWTVVALLALNLALLLWLVLRRPADAQQPIERLERELRDEIGRQAQAYGDCALPLEPHYELEAAEAEPDVPAVG